MLTDFHSSFTDGLTDKFAITSSLNVSPHLTNVATLPCEISEFKNCPVSVLSEADCHARLKYFLTMILSSFLVMILYLIC